MSAFERAAEHHRDVPAHIDSGFQRSLTDRTEALERLRDRAIGVAAREGLGGGGKSGNFFHTRRQSGVEPLHVGHQHRVADAGLAFDARHDLRIVRHLRNPLGRNEAGRLDHLQA